MAEGRNMFLRNQSAGNTIPEYIFIAFGVLVASIAVLISLGGGIQTQLGGLRSDMEHNVTSARVMEQARQQALTNAAGQSYSADGSIMGGNGSAGGNGNAMTTGANGNERNSARTIAVSLDNGRTQIMLSPYETLTMVRLSNQAHRMAEIAARLEQLSRQSRGASSTFRSLTVDYNGESYNAEQLINLLKWEGEIRTFIGLRSQLMEIPDLDPTAREYITNISNQVIRQTNALRNQADVALWSDSELAAISSMNTSPTTHIAGTNICRTAGEEDNGRQCGNDDDD